LSGGRDRRRPGAGIIAQAGHGFQAHLAAAHRPLVVLLKEYGEAIYRGPIEEVRDDVGAPLDLPVETLERVRSWRVHQTIDLEFAHVSLLTPPISRL